MATIGVAIDQDDTNRKFLRSLGEEWTMYTVSFRQNENLEDKELDDLYNDLRAFEAEVESKKRPSGYSHNAAFLSSASETIRIGEKGSTTFAQNPETASDFVLEAFLASHASPPLVNDDLEQIHPDDLEEMDLK